MTLNPVSVRLLDTSYYCLDIERTIEPAFKKSNAFVSSQRDLPLSDFFYFIEVQLENKSDFFIHSTSRVCRRIFTQLMGFDKVWICY